MYRQIDRSFLWFSPCLLLPPSQHLKDALRTVSRAEPANRKIHDNEEQKDRVDAQYTDRAYLATKRYIGRIGIVPIDVEKQPEESIDGQ